MLNAVKLGLCLFSGIALSCCDLSAGDTQAADVSEAEYVKLRGKSTGEILDEKPDFDSLPQVERNMLLNSRNICRANIMEKIIRQPDFRVELGIDPKYYGPATSESFDDRVTRNNYWFEQFKILNPKRSDYGFFRNSFGNPKSIIIFFEIESQRKEVACYFEVDGSIPAQIFVDDSGDFEKFK